MSDAEMDTRITAFISRLGKLDAGERAKFKRDAGKTLAEASSIGLFYRLLPYGLTPTQEEIYFLLATLYPIAEGGGSGNLGASLHRARDPKPSKNKGLDRRVEILLDADATQLSFRLRQAIKFLKSKRVRVQWTLLLNDLLKWNSPYRSVQKQWARAYFALPVSPDKQPATAAASEVGA